MTDNPISRRRFLVHGQVQGVGFRFWTIRQATRLELRGTVANLRNGSVEIEAEGLHHRLDELHQLLHHGPSTARVHSVQELPPRSSPLPEPFTAY
jgi:acylphosphatase